MLVTEQKLRHILKANGYNLTKSRMHYATIDNLCGYMISDCSINGVVAGNHFELSLDDVAQFVNDYCE